MKKTIALLVFLCIFSAQFATAEKKDGLAPSDLFALARKGTVCLSAAVGESTNYAYITGVIVEGTGGKVTVATSLALVTRGFNTYRLCSDISDLSAKANKYRMCFEYNLLFIDFDIKAADIKKYGNYDGRALSVGDSSPEIGEEVYLVRGIPGAMIPHAVFPVRITNSITPKGRAYSLYTIDTKFAGGSIESYIGSPIINKNGNVIGIMNTDINPERTGKAIHAEPYISTILIHPAKGIVAGRNSNDAFPRQSGLQLQQGVTGHWLPVRFGPVTSAWLEAAELPLSTRGVVVTNIYPEGSGCGLKIGDIITQVEGVSIDIQNWNGAVNFNLAFTRLVPKDRSGWTVEMVLYREGEQISVNARLQPINIPPSEPYNSEKLGISFFELSDFLRYRNDIPATASGVLAGGVFGGSIKIAVLRGMLNTIIKEVNGRPITKVSDLREVIEGTGASMFKFLVLDWRDFQPKYITIVL